MYFSTVMRVSRAQLELFQFHYVYDHTGSRAPLELFQFHYVYDHTGSRAPLELFQFHYVGGTDELFLPR